MKETKAALAGEMSGHIFFADEFEGYDDALYAGLRLLRLLNLSEPVQQMLMAGDLDQFRSVVESLSDEFDVVEIALAAIKLAHEAGGTAAIEIGADRRKGLFGNGQHCDRSPLPDPEVTIAEVSPPGQTRL